MELDVPVAKLLVLTLFILIAFDEKDFWVNEIFNTERRKKKICSFDECMVRKIWRESEEREKSFQHCDSLESKLLTLLGKAVLTIASEMIYIYNFQFHPHFHLF